LESVHQLRIETWNGKPGDGVDDKGADVFEPNRGCFGGFKRHLLQQVERVALEDGCTRLPSMALIIPVWRLARVSSLNPGIDIEAFESREMRKNSIAAVR